MIMPSTQKIIFKKVMQTKNANFDVDMSFFGFELFWLLEWISSFQLTVSKPADGNQQSVTAQFSICEP